MTAAGATDGPRTARSRALLALAAVAVAFAAADTYVVVLALPDMMASAGLSADELQRAAPIVSGFLLGYVAVLPLIGRIADLRGRVPVLVGSLLVFALGSLVTAAAYDLPSMVAGRVPPGRRRRRPGAGDAGAGRRPLPAAPARDAARGRRRGAGDRQRPRPAVRRGGARRRRRGGRSSGSTSPSGWCSRPCCTTGGRLDLVAPTTPRPATPASPATRPGRARPASPWCWPACCW